MNDKLQKPMPDQSPGYPMGDTQKPTDKKVLSSEEKDDESVETQGSEEETPAVIPPVANNSNQNVIHLP